MYFFSPLLILQGECGFHFCFDTFYGSRNLLGLGLTIFFLQTWLPDTTTPHRAAPPPGCCGWGVAGWRRASCSASSSPPRTTPPSRASSSRPGTRSSRTSRWEGGSFWCFLHIFSSVCLWCYSAEALMTKNIYWVTLLSKNHILQLPCRPGEKGPVTNHYSLLTTLEYSHCWI